MKVVFFGSSAFSLPSLHALAACDRHALVGVVAQPDRPSGRNRQIQRGVVHQAALDLHVPVILPEKIGAPESLAQLRAWQPDLIAVASYGQYIPSSVLNLPPHGVVNVHPSLLPKYRGAAPMQWSIAKGETMSGVTIFRVVKEMDAGDIILQRPAAIDPAENAVQLSDRFSAMGAGLLIEALDLIAGERASYVPQDHAAATYAPKISKAEGQIDWRLPARAIHNLIRGFQPWPCGYLFHEGAMIKVWRSGVEADRHGAPGEVLEIQGDGPVIATGDGALRLLELQPEGKKRMSGRAFLNGHPWRPGFVVQVTAPDRF